MRLEIRREPAAALDEYARVPIAFTVSEVFDVAVGPGDRFELATRHLARSYVKDYDGFGETPQRWAQCFDLSNWALFGAFTDGTRIGGAALAGRTPGVDILEDRVDLAVLWDIRVAPSARGSGIGSALFAAAADWAAGNGYRHIKVETQNINVAACRFYARQGCVLRAVRRGAYPGLPHEVQLLWYKDLE